VVTTRPINSALLDLDVARIGELNLLLHVIGPTAQPRDLLIKGILTMSGRSDRIPQPALYVEVAVNLGLITGSDDSLVLTPLGLEMLQASTVPPYDRLNPNQVRILAPEIIGHPELQDIIAEALATMHPISPSAVGTLFAAVPLSTETILGLKLLSATGFASSNDATIEISGDRLRELRLLLGDRVPTTEEDFRKTQQKIEERARDAEIFVMEFERSRLVESGCPDLGAMVTRVSEFDVGAHYDIHSFEEDGSPRFIEVKSSTNLHPTFVWSRYERAFAKSKGPAYWLYFVPRAQYLPDRKNGLYIIRDPEKKCGTAFIIEPESFQVTMVRGLGAIVKLHVAGVDVRLLE